MIQKYSYKGIYRIGIILRQIGGVIGIIIFTSFAGFIFWQIRLIEIKKSDNILTDSRITLVCFGLWCLVVGWFGCLALINASPTVWIQQDAILISAFLFFRISISWSDIIDIGAWQIPFGGVLVRARKITPFHRIYGWLYSRTWSPSFWIEPRIEDYEYLIREIRTRATNRRII